MSKFLNEFKEFAMRGNVLDMAIGWLIGGVNFADLKVTLPSVQVAGEELKAATINYGNFLQTCFDFLIVAFCIFMLIKVVNKFANKKKAEEEAPKPAPEPSAEEKLLMEIRDLLKEQGK